jgi:hypothetical protein
MMQFPLCDLGNADQHLVDPVVFFDEDQSCALRGTPYTLVELSRCFGESLLQR